MPSLVLTPARGKRCKTSEMRGSSELRSAVRACVHACTRRLAYPLLPNADYTLRVARAGAAKPVVRVVRLVLVRASAL
jgi:hypothetical protein